MTKEIISTTNAPGAIGPYSQAVRCGDFLYISGQIPIDPSLGEVIGDDVRTQTGQVIKNIGAVLEAAGLSYANVVKTTVFMTDLGEFSVMNEVYGSFFTESPPARAAFQVVRLPKDVLVEIEAIAHAG